MDPLSLTASVIAVVQISQAVLLFCYQIRGQIKDADDEISRIITDVEALAVILDELADILPDPGSLPSGTPVTLLDKLSLDEGDSTERRLASSACVSALRSCNIILKEVEEKIKPLAKPGLKSKLKWPFESSSIQRKLGIIEKQKATLQLALAAHHARTLGQQSHKIEDMQRQSKRAAILTWYKTSDPEHNHQVSRSKHEPDTAKWIFDIKDFVSWKENPGESLWIHGIPGAGKTILCSTIIDHMSRHCEGDSTNRVVHFYFDFADEKKQTVSNLLKSIIYQLIASEEVIPDSAASLHSRCNGLQEPNLDELLAVVIAEISQTERIFLMIDALDECPKEERQVFFKTFVKQSMPSNLNILITSRKEPDIEAALGSSFSRTICIQNAVINADVRVHVGKAIARDERLLKWKPAIRDEILDSIVDGAHGMFRWAVCQLDTMKKCLTPAMVRKQLKGMPETLDQTYDRILQSVPSLHESFVQSALHWLAFATRPLQLQELAEAAVLSPESEGFEPDACRLLDENLILELCGTLVNASIVQYNQYASDDWLSDKLKIQGGYYSSYYDNNKFSVVSLSHYSVKEYITSQRLHAGSLSSFYASEKLTNNFLAKCCLFYLLEFNQGEIASEFNFQESPLLIYSACNWMSHWKHASPAGQSTLRNLAERFFAPSSSNAYVNWLNVWIPESPLESRDSVFRYNRQMRNSAEFYPSTLYWAASLGDLALVELLVDQGSDIDARGGKFESPLGAAAYHCHTGIVEYLLQQGADSNLPSMNLGSVLQIAALGGSAKIVKLLLDAGADVNAQGGSHNTALIAAASKEHVDAVTLLIKRGADLNIGSRSHGSSLHQAAAVSDTKMAIILLGAGADINEIGGIKGTPLYAAAESGSMPLVQLLIRRGADVNKGSSFTEHGYPIGVAAHLGHSQVVKTLIRAGADVNLSMGHNQFCALEAAIESRDMPTFLAVLDAGGDPNAPCRVYMNCVHAAIWTGELVMAKILLERGAEFEDEAFLEATHRYDQNPWFLDTLLDRNPNINAWRNNDGSAMHLAIEKRNENAARLLLSRSPFLDAVSEAGSPLGVAIDRGMFDLAKELIHRGVDVNRRVKEDSPFGLAITHAYDDGGGDFTLADLLLEHGANVNGGNGAWMAKMHHKNSEAVLRYLAEKGRDLNSILPREKCTPLQLAADSGNSQIIDLLLELGADINGPKGDHGFVIHYALMSGDESMVRHVLDKGAVIDDSDLAWGSIVRAIKQNLTGLIPLLLEKGAVLNPPPDTPSPAAEAFENAPKEVFKMLMDRGAVFGEDWHTLERTIERRSLEDLRELLEYGVDPNQPGDWKQALTVAVTKRSKDAVDLLIEYGADVNFVPQKMAGITFTGRQGPLVAACRMKDLNMAQFLMDHGADPKLDCGDYGCPLSCAADHPGNFDLIQLLLDRPVEVRLERHIFERAVFGGEKIMKLLFQQAMTPEVREYYFDAALQNAAYYSLPRMCIWLLDQGGRPNYRGGRWGCPLTAAVSNDNSWDEASANNRRLVIDLLLQRGANVNPGTMKTDPDKNSTIKSDSFPTPLTAALTGRSYLTSKRIFDAGADPNTPGGPSYFPLQAAARFCPTMLEPLLAAGAEVNAVGGEYGTALHAAAYAHNVDSVKLLLAHGADATIVAGKYASVLQAAAKRETVSSGSWSGRKSVPVMKVLVGAGADVHARAGKYGSVVQMAAKSGNLLVVRWLVEEMGVDVKVKGGRFGSVRAAAVVKGRWGVVSYLERRFGRFKWGPTEDQYGKVKGWVEE